MKAVAVMKDAWRAYKPNFARLVIGTAVFLIVLVLLGIFSFIPLLLPAVFSGNAMLFLSLSLFSLFMLVAVGIAGLFVHGYIQFVSQAHSSDTGHSGKKPGASGTPSVMAMMKSSFEGKQMALLAYAFAAGIIIIFAVPYFYTSSIMSLVLAVPFAALFLFFTGLSPCVTAFERLSPLEAWGKSFELVVGNFWQFLGLCVVMAIIAIALSAIPIVGPVLLFVLVPWIALSHIMFYKKC